MEQTHEAIVILSFAGKPYMVRQQFDYDYEPYIYYYWIEGSYSDDYNRSLLIREQCDPEFPLFENSEGTIKLLCLLYNGVIEFGNTQGRKVEHVD